MRYDYSKKIRYITDPFQGWGQDGSLSLVYQPSDRFKSDLSLTYSDMFRQSDDKKIFEYTIIRTKNTFQFNRYLFFRVIAEYNDFYQELLTDLLVSFTNIPGTVIHAGYGSMYEREKWQNNVRVSANRLHEARRGLFFKASYLWRL